MKKKKSLGIDRVFVIAVILIGGLFFSLLLNRIVYRYMTVDLQDKLTASEQNYAQKIKNNKDSYKLLIQGKNQFEHNLPTLALVTLNQAVSIDPKYRDAWVYLGYVQLSLNKPNDAITCLKKAEEIDPIHAETYRLLSIAYKNADDKDSARKAEEKYRYLQKSE